MPVAAATFGLTGINPIGSLVTNAAGYWSGI